jgi:hypothetical protein
MQIIFIINYFKNKVDSQNQKDKTDEVIHTETFFLEKDNGKNRISVITSCMTFSCHRLNGPFSLKPIRLAWKQYSKKAIPQLIKMMATNPRL